MEQIKQKNPIPCSHCGNVFVPSRNDLPTKRKYCSKKCATMSADYLYRYRHPERVRERLKRWAEKNKQSISAYGKMKYKRMFLTGEIEIVKAKSAKRASLYCDELRDEYVIRLLTNQSTLRASDIPPELISAKRAHIQLGRALGLRKRVNHQPPTT